MRKYMLLETGEKIKVEEVEGGLKLTSPLINRQYTKRVGLLVREVPRSVNLGDMPYTVVDLTHLEEVIEENCLHFHHRMPQSFYNMETNGLTFVYAVVEDGVVFNCAYLHPGETYNKRLGRYHAVERFKEHGGCYMPWKTWRAFISA